MNRIAYIIFAFFFYYFHCNSTYFITLFYCFCSFYFNFKRSNKRSISKFYLLQYKLSCLLPHHFNFFLNCIIKSEKNSICDIILSLQQFPKEILHMLYRHINIEFLTSIQIYFENNIKAYLCAKLLKIVKDRVYRYYKLFKEGLSIFKILEQYRKNRTNGGRKKISLSSEKLEAVKIKLKNNYSIDSICGRDKLLNSEERCSTKTMYRMVKEGIISNELLRRKGKKKPKNYIETRGKINEYKTIANRDIAYPCASSNEEFGHFEGDTIIGKKRCSAIVTLVEKHSKYIVLLKASRKSQDVYNAILKWIESINKSSIKSIIFDRGKEFSKWKELENSTGIDIFFSDPGSPGQRGLNENSNGIVRKDLPKSTDLSKHSQKELNEIAINGIQSLEKF